MIRVEQFPILKYIYNDLVALLSPLVRTRTQFI